MKAFELDRSLVDSYASFSRSFSKIRAADLKTAIDQEYDDGHFWPDSLLSINPQFEAGPSADELATAGVIDSLTAKVFRAKGEFLRFHAHQGQAIAKAQARQSFVVTTGTGSGKSLCFFVPIIDSIIRAKKAGDAPRTRAIIVYPMNALANSQLKEIERFIGQAEQRDDRMRATVVPSEKTEDIQAALAGVVAQPAVVYSDKDHTFLNVIRAFGMGHQTVVHSAKEFVRGEVHSNTADGIGSMLERARMGVWHRMSRLHLQRYLDEIGFRWNCRLKREFVSKSGRRRRIITTIPLPDMLSRLLYPATGRQVRRTQNYGFSTLPSSLPVLSAGLLSGIQPTHGNRAPPGSHCDPKPTSAGAGLQRDTLL